MGLELGLNLESTFGFRPSLAGSAGSLTIVSLTEELIAQAGAEASPEDETGLLPLMRTHSEKVAPEQVQSLQELIKRDQHTSKRA